MTAKAVLLAAGSSERFGMDKLELKIGGKPVWLVSFEALYGHPEIDSVGVVAHEAIIEEVKRLALGAAFVVKGGATRTESAKIGVHSLPEGTEVVLIHDAARPFVTAKVISNVIDGVREHGAAFPAVPVVDTVKIEEEGTYRTLDRSRLVACQTPQGALRQHFERAFAQDGESTDDVSLLEAIGIKAVAVEGDRANIKLTVPEDAYHARTESETRTGIGYDVHRFSDDPSRLLWLGGVLFAGEEPGLEGHSDADVVIHAVVDALLGAASLGDIGLLYPNTDQRWKDEPSSTFLQESSTLVVEHGWSIVNIDISVLAERPKIMLRRDEIQSKIAELTGLSSDRVSIKATTNEGLGAIGRGEGIAAFAVATVKRRV